MKKNICEIVVVEGKSDTIKLKKLFNVDTIETNGSAIDKKTINLIKEIAKSRGVILFLDPDGPGEKIRQVIARELKVYQNVFISKKDIKSNAKKIGVAEANDNAIIKAFENITTFNTSINSLTWDEYLSLSLDSKKKRDFVCNYLQISLCNHKQLYKRLNMMNIAIQKLQEILLKNSFN